MSNMHDVADIYILGDRPAAEYIVLKLMDIANEYGMVSVAEYLSILKAPFGQPNQTHGWTSVMLSEAKIVEIPRRGYIIKFPPAQPMVLKKFRVYDGGRARKSKIGRV